MPGIPEVARDKIERCRDTLNMAESFMDLSDKGNEIATATLEAAGLKAQLRRANADIDKLSRQVESKETRIAELEKQILELENRVNYDPLTRIPSREAFLEQLDAEWRRHARAHSTLGFVYFDIDNFKAINDTFDHQVGDQVLTAVAAQAFRCIRRSGEMVGRLSGDEFAVLVPNAKIEDVAGVAVKVRLAIASMSLQFGDKALTVGTSHGVAIADPYNDGRDPNILIKRADDALHVAKENGRNRVVAHRIIDNTESYAAVNETPTSSQEQLQKKTPGR